jgi:CobQ-like glutamine amidotransferase family enzyme
VSRVRRVNILHLYPERMNLYGDRGNVLVLSQRTRWREIACSVVTREVGEPIDWDAVDLVFMGGGEDTHQSLIAEDFLALAPELVARLRDGMPMLAICGAFQLLGHFYQTADGRELPGVGFLDVYTKSGKVRAIGDVVVQTTLDITPQSLVGFENHGGRTYLAKGTAPLGTVRMGQGNNSIDQTEGAVQDHVIGTYLHGSLLPKNPHLADLLLFWALAHRGFAEVLEPLPSQEEMDAHQVILTRARK